MKKFVSLLMAVMLVIGIIPFNGTIKASAAVACNLSVGDIVEFGTYPQDSVNPQISDDVNLLDLVEEWTSMGCYGGNNKDETVYGGKLRLYNNGSMKPTDYVMYADIEYNGEKYRALKITGERPTLTGGSWTPCTERISLFKFEPIQWEVTKAGSSSVTLLAKKAIDCQPFNNYVTLGEDGETAYSNEACTVNPVSFSSSSLYKWLNNEFYNTAFSESEKKSVSGNVTTESSASYSSTKREKFRKYMTLYAKSQGYVEDGIWWSTTGQGTSRTVVEIFGKVDGRRVTDTTVGVAPMITIKPDHLYEEVSRKEPTCTETGYIEYTCSACGNTYKKRLPLAEHKLTHVTEKSDCTKTGTEYDICSECGSKFNETEVPVTAHSYTSTVTKEPTCTENGVRTYTCSVCGDEYAEEIPAAEHNLTHITEKPTCVTAGAEYDICTICGAIFDETETPPLGHNYVSAITTEATCKEKGIITYTCTECESSYSQYIPVTDHKLTHVKEDATCTKAGTEYDICSECRNKFNETEIKATGHSYTSAVTKEPTCTEKGVMIFTCECGDSYTEEIPLAEHKLTHFVEKSTCTENGSEYDVCSECGNRFNETEIKPTGHLYTSAITKAPTCTEKGILTFTCECGDTYTEEIPIAEHKLTHFVEKATCTETGSEYDICSVCKKIFNTAGIAATGHTYENGVCKFCGKAENWNYTLNNGTVTITGYTGHEKELEIPAEIGGYPVTAIAESAYAYNTGLEYVSVPNSIFIIGRDAFRGCTNLKEICISDSVSTICEGAFADCTSLAIVFIESTNTVLKGAFSNNDNRLSFIVPDGTKTAANVADEGFAYNTFMYPKEKDGKGAIAVSGSVTLYADLEYNYWSRLIEKYPYAFYLYFDSLVFDGVSEDEVIIIDDANIDENGQFLTMNEVYISIDVDGRCMTFRDLIEMLKNGEMEAVITFSDSQGVKRTFFEKIGDFFTDLFNAISRAINAIVKIFKKK